MRRYISLGWFLIWIIALLPSTPTAVLFHNPRPCGSPPKTTLRYHGDGTGMAQAYSTLISCPYITALDLRVGMNGCVRTPEPYVFPFARGDQFPPLRNLSVSGYNWEYATWLDKARGWTSLERWQRAQDFSVLEHLQIRGRRGKSFYVHMKDQLPGLRTLNASVELFDDYFTEFLVSVPPLEGLSVNTASFCTRSEAEGGIGEERIANCSGIPLEDILDRHGSSLRQLSLSSPESEVENVTRSTLSVAQLDQIAASCPRLTHLTVDIDRNGTWPNATLDALGRFPELTDLRVRFELGENYHLDEYEYTWRWTRRPWPVRTPIVTRGAALRLFRDLRAKKQGKALDKLEIEIGDWPKEEYMGPLPVSLWSEDWWRLYRCGVLEYSDQGGEDISCKRVCGKYKGKKIGCASYPGFDEDVQGEDAPERVLEMERIRDEL